MSRSSLTSRLTGRVVAFVVLAVFAGGLPTSALAQAPVFQQVQSLRGTVQDSRGLPLLGAFVAVIALGSDQPAAIVVTDARGDFHVGNLRAGVYSLLVGSLGFAGTILQGVNVPTAAPISLQLESASERTLSAFDAPLDLSWALRSSKRDVLRQTGTTLVSDTGDVVSDDSDFRGLAGEPAASVAGPIAGEFRLWSFTRVGDRETVGVTSFGIGSEDSWNLTAHLGDGGALWASSELSRTLGGGHALNVGFGYVGGSFDALLPGALDEEARTSWIGRAEVRDRWQVLEPVSISYGVRYEHHSYLADGDLVSPSVEITLEPLADTRFLTGVAYNSEGLGLARADSGFDVMALLGQSNLRIADTSNVRPEQTLRYHFGVQQQIGPAQVSVKAYYDDMTDELLGVYVAGPEGVNNYLLFNVGDASARGFEFGVAGELLARVSGQITYAYRNRDHEYSLPVPEGAAPAGEDFASWSLRQTHELQASVAAEVAPSKTRFVASYSWRQGMPVVRDGEITNRYGHFDLRVRQLLPFRALDTEWSAMVQIRNLLGPEYDGLYNVSLTELMGLTRGIAGGLAVRF